MDDSTGSAIAAGLGQRQPLEAAATRRRRLAELTATWRLSGALIASAIVIALAAVAVLHSAGGWEYYRTPLAARPYAAGHDRLRPSGVVGHWMGIVGLALMVVPVAYTVRKKSRRLARVGSMKVWLDVHVFCGIVGPALVTFHAAFKFNGLISVAYWSMLAVMLSGFVGRYLYVRMPRSIRGAELSYEEILGRAAALQSAIRDMGLPAAIADRLGLSERDDLESAAPRVPPPRPRALRREMRAAGVPPDLVREAIRLASVRATLLRRLQYLKQTRRLFAAWHVFHQPLVWVMFAIVLVHIGVAVYLGYAFFLQR
jgi:hypothetical protein